MFIFCLNYSLAGVQILNSRVECVPYRQNLQNLLKYRVFRLWNICNGLIYLEKNQGIFASKFRIPVSGLILKCVCLVLTK